MGISSMGILLTCEKQCMGYFSMGMCEVLPLQMNQSHNDDVTNMNG